MHILKLDISDSFYHIGLIPMDTPNMGLVFSSEVEDKELLAIMLTLRMVWKNLLPIFCMTTQKVVDLANAALRCNTPALSYRLYDME